MDVFNDILNDDLDIDYKSIPLSKLVLASFKTHEIFISDKQDVIMTVRNDEIPEQENKIRIIELKQWQSIDRKFLNCPCINCSMHTYNKAEYMTNVRNLELICEQCKIIFFS